MKENGKDKKNNFQQWQVVIFLVAYLVISATYQAVYPYFVYWPTYLSQEIVLDACYAMQMRLPVSIPILSPIQSEQAKQVTFWVWKIDAACNDEAEISFSINKNALT